MAITKVISFDDGLYDQGQFVVGSGWDGVTLSTSSPRTGTHVLNVGGGNTQSWRTNFPASYATGWVYFAFRVASLPVSGDSFHNFYIADNGTTHLRLTPRADGKMSLYQGSGTLLGTTTGVVVSAGQWVQVAMKYTIANSGGICKVRFNGLTSDDIDFSGDTQNGATAFANQLWFSMTSMGSAALQVDDIVIQDTTGSSPENDWLGDIECKPILVTANDASTGYVVGGTSPAATLYESVDDPTSDEFVTTIDSSAVNDYASFVAQDIAAGTGNIYAVVVQLRAAKSAAGLREVQGRLDLGGTVATSGNLTLQTTMQTLQGIFHRDPASATWTAANVNSVKIGVKTVT